MKFILEIELGNDAMQHYGDIRQALRAVCVYTIGIGKPKDGDGRKIMDENGNSVGKWEVLDVD